MHLTGCSSRDFDVNNMTDTLPPNHGLPAERRRRSARLLVVIGFLFTLLGSDVSAKSDLAIPAPTSKPATIQYIEYFYPYRGPYPTHSAYCSAMCGQWWTGGYVSCQQCGVDPFAPGRARGDIEHAGRYREA
jgi:hypothetical protein